MKSIIKKEFTNQKKSVPKDSLSTGRIMRLIKAYQNEKEVFYEYMGLAHQRNQKALKIARNLKEELAVNALTSFKLDTERCAAVKVLPGKSRVVIDAGEAVPEAYVCVRTQRAYNMRKIEEELKQGKHIPGTHLESQDGMNLNGVNIDITPIKNPCRLGR